MVYTLSGMASPTALSSLLNENLVKEGICAQYIPLGSPMKYHNLLIRNIFCPQKFNCLLFIGVTMVDGYIKSCVSWFRVFQFQISVFQLPDNCQTIKVDCLLISPHSTTLKSHVKVMRITDMITNIKELLIITHSPCQYHRKCKENSNTKARLKGLFLL